MQPSLPIWFARSFIRGGRRRALGGSERRFSRNLRVMGLLLVGTAIGSAAELDLLREEWLTAQGYERGRIRSDADKRLELSSLRTKIPLLARCSRQYDLKGKTLRCSLVFSNTDSEWTEAGWQIEGILTKGGNPFHAVVRPVHSQIKVGEVFKRYKAGESADRVEMTLEFEEALVRIFINGSQVVSEAINYAEPMQTLSVTARQTVVEFPSIQLSD